MIALAGLLVLVAVALLVGGLSGGDTALLWSSVGVSGLAAVVLAVQTVRRNRATAATAAEASTAAEAPKAAGASRPAEPSEAPEAAEPVTAVAPVAARTPASVETGDAGAPRAAAEAPVVAEPAVDGPVVPEPVEDAVVEEPVVEAPAAERSATRRAATPAAAGDGEPPEEEVEVTDLLLVIDLTDEVVVVDEHPRYHLAGCSQTAGAEEIPLPLVEARQDGFTACGVCCPDQHVAAAERSRRAAAKSRTA